jgi:hypothetical protein
VAPRSGLERWAGLGGVLYVVLFITGTVVTFSGQPDTDSSPAKLIAYYSDSGHRDRINIGWLLVLIGVFLFLWFLVALWRLVHRAGDDGFLGTVTLVGGTVYATTTLVGFSLNDAIKTMSDDTFHHRVFPELIHAADDAGYVIHSAGGVGAASMMIAASIAAARGGLIPGWARVVGVIAGLLAVFSIFFFPQFLIALWVLVAGVLVWRAGPSRAATAPAAP